MVPVEWDDLVIAAVIKKKGFLVGTFVCDNSIHDYKKDTVYKLSTENKDEVGGHCVLITGVGRKDNKSYFEIRNSFGSKWGNGGFGLIPKDLFSVVEGISGATITTLEEFLSSKAVPIGFKSLVETGESSSSRGQRKKTGAAVSTAAEGSSSRGRSKKTGIVAVSTAAESSSSRGRGKKIGVAAVSTAAESSSNRGRRKKIGVTDVSTPATAATATTTAAEIPTYCLCNKTAYGKMVACDNHDCKTEWFHFPCVGLNKEPKGEWYCSDCAKTRKKLRGR